MPLRKKTTKPRRKAPRRKPAMRRNKTANIGEHATLSCVRTLANAITNQGYAFDSIQLRDYDRAVQVAQAYQRYRITGVKVTWKPTYDTYSSATPQQKPNLYYMIDKSGSVPDNFSLEALKQMGARPKAYDEKPISVMWKPAVLNETLNTAGAGSASGYKVSPYLSTNANATNPGVWAPSTIAHQGLKWYMEAGGAVQTLFMEIEVQFEFTKPLFPALQAQPALGLTYAVLDASPDGVEGGTDGITIPLVR